MFEIGNYVVKPGSGICQIKDILHPDFSGTDKKRLYYLLIPLENKNSKLYVPTDTAQQTLRKKQRSEQGKKSTATDERYFKLAEDHLYSELAFALGKDKNEMRQLICDTIDRPEISP